MDAEQRKILKELVDAKARERIEENPVYMNCDPEALSTEAIRMDELGYGELASGLRNYRDKVVNPLLAEGWSIERIEAATYRRF